MIHQAVPAESLANESDGRPVTRTSMRPKAGVQLALVRRAVKVACVVGTCLTLINQGDSLLSDGPAPTLWWKIPLTYCVPFFVSLYSAIAATRNQ